ncbi:MAG: hypothetical protein ACK40U_07565, partial [Fervidobacterium pennivorans]
FPLSTAISQISGEKALLESGKNIGAKPGYVFQSIADGYTTSFMRLERVYEKSSEARIFYIVPGADVEPHSLVIETKQFPDSLGMRFGFFIEKEAYGMKIGYIQSNIYGNYQWSLTFSFSTPYDTSSVDKMISPVAFEFSKFLFGDNIELLLGTSFNIVSESSGASYISDYGVLIGLALSSYVRNSVLAYGGICFYTEINYTILLSNFELSPNNLNLSIGLDMRF